MRPITLILKTGRVCTSCGVFKFWNEFGKSTTSSTGHREMCKPCRSKARAARPRTARRKYVVNEEGRECIDCYKFKPWAEFCKSGANKKYGRGNICKPCSCARTTLYRLNNPKEKKRFALARYGITIDEYETMLEEQGRACAICGNQEEAISPRSNKVYSLAVDHDHGNGKVRGLLCTRCNHMLGNAQDNPKTLRKAATYLETNY